MRAIDVFGDGNGYTITVTSADPSKAEAITKPSRFERNPCNVTTGTAISKPW